MVVLYYFCSGLYSACVCDILSKFPFKILAITSLCCKRLETEYGTFVTYAMHDYKEDGGMYIFPGCIANLD